MMATITDLSDVKNRNIFFIYNKLYSPMLLLGLSIFFSLSCSTANKKLHHQNNNSILETVTFDKQGHRGCRGLMPENTIPAMLKALDLGVTTLEMDICFSKDKKAFLSHEPFFNHEITTTPEGRFIEEADEKKYNMYNMAYDQICKYDVGLKPHPRFPQQQKIKVSKPLLADLFTAVKAYMKQSKRPYPYFNIETKTLPETDNIFHPEPAEFVDRLMRVIIENDMEKLVTIQSFDFRTLQYLHKNYPAIKTVMLIEDTDKRSLDEQLTVLGFIPAVYSPAYELVNAALIKKCHDQHIKVIPWTVNNAAEINKLTALGVDGIISDYPDLFNTLK